MSASSTPGLALPGNRWDLLAGHRPAVPPAVSVVVAHYRQPDQLARTIAALRGQDHPADRLQIIVADDGSPEPPRVADDVLLVRQEDRGFRLAAARNLGARHASGDVLVFLDADTVPEPVFIRELTRLPALAPDCLTVGRRRHADLTTVDAAAIAADGVREAARARALPEPEWLRGAYRATRDLLDADLRSYRFVIGAVVACSRQLFDETGGFDETFTAYGGEDWEWAYRAWLRGAVLAHVPEAVAWHDGPDAAVRTSHTLATKNAETLRLADLIPVPGSVGHGVRPEKADIAISPPPEATAGQRFVSVDQAVAAVSGSTAAWDGCHGPRFDRVRVRVDLLRPGRVPSDGLHEALDRLVRDDLGSIELRDAAGAAWARVTSTRAEARARRWQRDDLFEHVTSVVIGFEPFDGEVDVEAYLGGWS